MAAGVHQMAFVGAHIRLPCHRYSVVSQQNSSHPESQRIRNKLSPSAQELVDSPQNLLLFFYDSG